MVRWRVAAALGLTFASVVGSIAIVLAIIGGTAGIISAAVVVLKIRNLTDAIDKLAERVVDVESTLGGGR